MNKSRRRHLELVVRIVTLWLAGDDTKKAIARKVGRSDRWVRVLLRRL